MFFLFPLILCQVPHFQADFYDVLNCIAFALIYVFFPRSFSMLNCSGFYFIVHFFLQSFLYVSMDQFLPCWLPQFFCYFYINPYTFTDYVYSTVKVFLKIIFMLLFDYTFCYTFFFTVNYTVIWYHCTVLQMLLSWLYPCLHQYSCNWCWYWDLQ